MLQVGEISPDLGNPLKVGDLHATSSRAVSVVFSCVEVRGVLALLLERELIERLSDRELAVDALLRDAFPALPNRTLRRSAAAL